MREGAVKEEAPHLGHKTTQQRQASKKSRRNQAYRQAWLGKVCWVVRGHCAGGRAGSGRSM